MNSFQDFDLRPQLGSALKKIGFETPTEIQKRVIPMALENLDLVVCAETGSGKTAAYAIPMICKLLDDPGSMAVVMAPTRELAQQIAEFIRQLTVDLRDLQTVTIVGGADIRKQLTHLKRNPRIIVATPGRLIDHLKRRSVQLDAVKTLILDEGDRMLDMGFAPQLDQILKFLPKQRQTSLFTATITEKIQSLARKYLSNPQKVNVGQTSKPVLSIQQTMVQLAQKEKLGRVVDELNQRKGSIIIFMRTKSRTNKLAKDLNSYGFGVELIHGGRTQGQRNKAIQNFRAGTSRILCATDLAARGIDVPQVEHVINFDLPVMTEDYVHRVGRTGRNGASGEALSFVTPEDFNEWQDLVRRYQIQPYASHLPVKAPRSFSGPSRRPQTSERKSNQGGGRRSKPAGRSSSSRRPQW